MKTVLFFLLIAFLTNTQSLAQTTYADEIAIRTTLVQRLHEQVKSWEDRKSILLKTEQEYQLLIQGKTLVDRKVEEIRRSDREQHQPVNIFDGTYSREKNHLTKILELSAAMGQAPINTYKDLERWIAVHEKDGLKNIQELEQLESKLQKGWSDIERTEKEIAVLKGRQEFLVGKATLEGDWMLPAGAGGNNIVNIYYNEKDRHFYGTVTKSVNLVCHPPGTILFSVKSSPGSNTQFTGMEYGYDFDQATRKCRPQQARLTLSVSGMNMNYHNGAQRLILYRVKAAPSPTLPMEQQKRDQRFDAFDDL